MKRTEQGSLVAVISIIATLVIAALLSFIFWQNFIQSKDANSENTQSVEWEPADKGQIVTSTLKGWSVSLQAPATWSVDSREDKLYDYDAREFVAGKITTITEPSGKVAIRIQQTPFFSGDGTCGSSTIQYLNKEVLPDNKLVLVEAVSPDDSFFLSLTSPAAASAFTEMFNSCFSYRDMINQEGRNVLPPEEGTPNYKVPYVSVGISPNLSAEERKSWTTQMTLDFLQSQEYLEAKKAIKTFAF